MAQDERIASSIPTLINGVSRQAPSFRLVSQAEEQINCLSSVVYGVAKRPPAEFVRVLSNTTLPGAFVHTINRDTEERYIVLFTGDNLRVFDLMNDGVECAVNFPQGRGYIITNNPTDALRVVTIADHTFIVNRNIIPGMDTSVPTDEERNEALVYVKTGVSNTTYEVMVEGAWHSYTTPKITTTQTSESSGGRSETSSEQTGENPSTSKIASELAAKIRTNRPDFLVEINGPSLRLRKINNEDFRFSVRDSFGDQALVGVKREVEKWQDLPPKAWDGFKVYVVGENNDTTGAFYLEYDSRGSTTTGLWRECPGWNQCNHFDPTTMPHKLVRNADGSFTFSRAVWTRRECGDDDSVPLPSFIGSRMEDVFFYRNRFGVICDENVCLSEPISLSDDGRIQWWADSAMSVLGTDPIDVAVTTSGVSLLRHAVIYGESLMLFADQAQFQLGSGNTPTLAPDTVKVDPVTDYQCSPKAKPVNAGQSIYFCTETGGMGGRAEYSAVREYSLSPEAIRPEAPEITSHIPDYIPKGVVRMDVAINDQTLFLLAEETPSLIYVYRYFWVGEEKVQSCWSKWDFGPGAKIMSFCALQSTLFVVVERNGNSVCLEKLDLHSRGERDEIGYEIHLDRKFRLRGTYDGTRTRWNFPYSVPANSEMLAVFGEGSVYHPTGQMFEVRKAFTREGERVYSMAGDHSDFDVIFGFPYDMLYRFSPQLLRESKEPGAAAITGGRLQLLRFLLNYSNSGVFEARVRAEGRREIVKVHGDKLGAIELKLDKPFIDSGVFRFPVLARADRVQIEITSRSHFPVSFQSAEWEGTYNRDARRI